VRHQLEVMGMALHALKEANRGDAVELLTLAIRSREMMLEGRRDEEAQAVRQRAPNRGQLAEILSMAARLWREFGKPDKGAVVGQLAEQMAAVRRPRESEREQRGQNEREVALRQIKIMRYALHALAEAEKKDAADLLERAIHSRELALEGRRDEEATRIRQLKELGQTERAVAVGRLVEEMKGRRAREQR